LHPELLPKKFQKEEQNTVATVQHDLGSNSGDETMITTMGIKGISLVSPSSTIQYFKTGDDDKKRNELFHVRFIVKHTKVDTLFDSGSQVNLISEEIVEELGLNN